MTKSRTAFIRIYDRLVATNNIAHIGLTDDCRLFITGCGKDWIKIGYAKNIIANEIDGAMKEYAISRVTATELVAKKGYVLGRVEDVVMAINEAEATGEIVDVVPGAFDAANVITELAVKKKNGKKK
jgi:sporulation protein YlmC with PRC-barrel domain